MVLAVSYFKISFSHEGRCHAIDYGLKFKGVQLSLDEPTLTCLWGITNVAGCGLSIPELMEGRKGTLDQIFNYFINMETVQDLT